MRILTITLATIIASSALTPASAQKRQASPEERIERLEKQVNQVQRRVYGKQPVDTAGYVMDPAVTQSDLQGINARLDALEQRLADMARTTEENSNRVATMEAELFRLKAEAERRPPPQEDPVVEENVDAPPPRSGGPKYENRDEPADDEPREVRAVPRGDPDFNAAGEEAYDVGYNLWQQKKYSQAITALRAMASSFPGHRRVSWANNLAGRAMLDKGDYRAAAEALLANYRGDPRGERAADSLFYLGQASFKLKQPGQACKAYSELENVYGATMRGDIARQLPAAKAAAKCG